jgi:hypothetical protein
MSFESKIQELLDKRVEAKKGGAKSVLRPSMRKEN